MFNSIINVITIIFTFVTNKENIAVVKSVIKITNEINNVSKNGLDNAGLARAATFIRNQTKDLTNEKKAKVADKITKSKKGALREITLGINSSNGLKIGTSIGDITYNHNDGSVTWGRKIRF